MPTRIGTVTDWQSTPLGTQLKPFWPDPSTLARMLMEAGDEARDIADRRKFMVPPTTAIPAGTATIAAGALQIPVNDGTNIYELDAVLFPRTGELLTVAGAAITSYNPQGTDPVTYPGTIYLQKPTANQYVAGDTVQVLRQWRQAIRGLSSSDISASMSFLNQQSQIAMMHAPPGSYGQSSRLLRTEDKPLLSVYGAWQALPWSNIEEQIDLSLADVDFWRGQIRLPLGAFNPRGGKVRIVYTAGYTVAPGTLVDAVCLLLAAKVGRAMNPSGSNSVHTPAGTITTKECNLWHEAACQKLLTYRLDGGVR